MICDTYRSIHCDSRSTMNMTNHNVSAKFEYILEADTTLTAQTREPITYLNCRHWYDFRVKANKTKLRNSENIYFSLKLEFLSQDLDAIDWILWDKWAQNHIRPRAIEIKPNASTRIIYDKHEANQIGLVANRIDQLTLKLRFNCASSQFSAFSSENVSPTQCTIFRLVIESFSDETGIKFDSVSCLIKVFEHEDAHKQFQIDQYQLVRNYVDILNPTKSTKVIMNPYAGKNDCVKQEVSENVNSQKVNTCNAIPSFKITINIFYLYLNDKNFTPMPLPLSFDASNLTMDTMKDKLFLPLIQRNVGDNSLRIENVYFRKLKNAFDRKSSISLSDSAISKVFKHNCGYKLELEPIKKSHHTSHRLNKLLYQTKPKILHEITNNNRVGGNLEKFVNKNVNNFCNNFDVLPVKSKAKEHICNLHIIECFIVD